MSPKNAIKKSDILAAKSLASKVSKWLSTPEGRQSMTESQQQGQDMVRRMREARNIPPESLREQVGV